MRLRCVRIRAFGPFKDRELELAPGMTVIVGENEAGKSTWHAATYAALCGMRRGQGRRREDVEFARLHRPWDGDSWSVEACIELAGGRQIEITHDLDGRVDCRAVDTGLGRRDVSSEIMFEGAPDASRWLGLNRQTFQATACVGQAEILDVLQSAGALQEHLQRAAATAGTDETAARALELIDDYQKERVGTERANSVKPLRQALDRLTRAQTAAEKAVADHTAFLDQLEAARRLDEEAAQAQHRLDILTAAALHLEAEAAAERLERARGLQDQLAGDAVDLELANAAAERVSKAIAAWESVPTVETLNGPSAAELERELAGLPEPPIGDLAPAGPVIEAETAWRAARAALEAHASAEPPSISTPPTRLSPSELRDLARDLALQAPNADLRPSKRRADLERELASTPRQRVNVALLVAAGAVAIAAVIAAVVLAPVIALPALIVAIALAAAGLRDAFGDRRSRILEELRALDAELGTAQVAADSITERVAEATERATAAGLPPDPAALMALAADAEQAAARVLGSCAMEQCSQSPRRRARRRGRRATSSIDRPRDRRGRRPRASHDRIPPSVHKPRLSRTPGRAPPRPRAGGGLPATR